MYWSRTLSFFILFNVFMLGSGCDQDKPSTSGSPVAQDVKAPPVQEVKPSSITVHVKRAFSEAAVAVKLSLPASWKEGDHDDVARLLPKVQPDEFFYTQLQISEGSTSCEGTCDKTQILANIKLGYDAYKARLETPNLNSGDPKKDAYRAKLDVFEDNEESEGGLYKHVFAAKVTCPGKGDIPCSPQLGARCFYYQEGADYYLVASGKGPLAAENSAWPELVALCSSLTIVAPGNKN